MSDDDKLTAAGGWCAPSKTIYDVGELANNTYKMLADMMPVIRVLRPGTPEWEANQQRLEMQRITEQSMQTLVQRLVGNISRLQEQTLERVYADAADAGMDVLWEEPPYHHTMWRWNRSGDLAAYRFIGLSLVERSTEHWRRLQPDAPIILRETAHRDDTWDEDY